jgi:hypothetical protein
VRHISHTGRGDGPSAAVMTEPVLLAPHETLIRYVHALTLMWLNMIAAERVRT